MRVRSPPFLRDLAGKERRRIQAIGKLRSGWSVIVLDSSRQLDLQRWVEGLSRSQLESM